MARILDTAILERLERTLAALGSPAVEGAGPGLSSDEMARLTVEFPGELSSEAELWYGWRTWGPGGDMLPYARYTPLNDAVEHYKIQRRWAIEYGGTSPHNPDVTADDWWHPLWLPLFVEDGGVYVVIDHSASDGKVAPIRQIDGQGFGDDTFDPVVAPSLGSFITDTLDAIDAGAYTYHADDDYWTDAPPA